MKIHINSTPKIERQPKRNEIKLYRTIAIDCIDQLDTQNLGCHWTESPNFNYCKSEKVAKITAVFSKKCINKEATAISNNGYAKEEEVVIFENSNPISVFVRLSVKGEFLYECDRFEFENCSTGLRIDKWVNNPLN